MKQSGQGKPRSADGRKLARAEAENERFKRVGKIWKKFKKGACGFALFGYNLFCCWGTKDFQTTKP